MFGAVLNGERKKEAEVSKFLTPPHDCTAEVIFGMRFFSLRILYLQK